MKKLLTALYEKGASLRRHLYRNGILKAKELNIPVISIGNLSVGGTGKTPITIETAKYFKQKGLKPCVLSRGYKRTTRGPLLVSDGERIFVKIHESGDEPYLIAKHNIPVVVGESRYKAGLLAIEELNPDIFILDDGFQHYQLHRDVDILVIDATRPFWRDYPLPFGNLREPRSFNKYADAFVITKTFLLSEKEKEEFFLQLEQYTKPYFIVEEKFNRLTDGHVDFSFDIMFDVEVGVFAGLGNNDQFFRFMIDCAEKCGFKIKYTKSFPDHYSYDKLDLYDDVDFWITTYKDFIKLSPEIIKKYNILSLMYDVELPEDYYKYLEKKLYIRKGFKIPQGKG